MDDLTLVDTPQDITHTINTAISAIQSIGLQPNIQKSKLLTQQPIQATLPLADTHASFDLLGANVGYSGQDSFNERVQIKVQHFFDKLNAIQLHPQLKWTILRMCGVPKITYYLNTHHPNHTQNLVKHFDTLVKSTAESIVGFSIRENAFYHAKGAGFPQFTSMAAELYNTSVGMALHGLTTARLSLGCT